MIRVQEIFTSIDGEVNHSHQGCFSTFVRLNGCNLRCSYCDTVQAQQVQDTNLMNSVDVLEEVLKRGCNKVTITGGEPLYQAGGLMDLLDILLWKSDVNISVETNGSYPIFHHLVSGRLTWVVDYKLPSSGQMDRMMPLKYYQHRLSHFDFLKFVIMDRKDYEEAREITKELDYLKGGGARIAFSPVWGVLDGESLIEWCKEDRLFDVIINLQLHKILALKEGEKK